MTNALTNQSLERQMELAQDIILSNAYLRANQLLLLLAYLTGFGALFFSIAFIRWTERANSAATTAATAG